MLLLDCLYRINSQLKSDNSAYEKLQLKRIGRLSIKAIANCLLPILFRVTRKQTNCISGDTLPVVVSLTSFPQRINRVWLTVESILRQSKKPQHIVLWLSRDQFPGELHDLPSNLKKQINRGLTIRFVDGDIRSHKKYYYAFNEFSQFSVLTIDDDLLFPSTFVADIYDCSVAHPDDVIASFGFRYHWDESKNYIAVDSVEIEPGQNGCDLFYGSGGGTLFKPERLLDKLGQISEIMKLCPTADDIYLNALTRLCGFGVFFNSNNPLLSIVNLNDIKLNGHNGELDNPESRNAVQMKALISYMQKSHGVNPFQTSSQIC